MMDCDLPATRFDFMQLFFPLPRGMTHMEPGYIYAPYIPLASQITELTYDFHYGPTSPAFITNVGSPAITITANDTEGVRYYGALESTPPPRNITLGNGTVYFAPYANSNGVGYSLDGSTVTFTTTPADGDIVACDFPVLDVRNYSPHVDGVTDDTAAIQAALDRANEAHELAQHHRDIETFRAQQAAMDRARRQAEVDEMNRQRILLGLPSMGLPLYVDTGSGPFRPSSAILGALAEPTIQPPDAPNVSLDTEYYT